MKRKYDNVAIKINAKIKVAASKKKIALENNWLARLNHEGGKINAFEEVLELLETIK